MRKRKPEFERLSAEEVQQLAEERAQSMLQVSATRAFKLLDQGKLNGTIAEAEFQTLRFMMNANK